MSEAQVPNSIEWLENYYQHQKLDDWESPFGGISNSISDSTRSFGDDFFPGSDSILASAIPKDISLDPDSTGTNTDIHVFSPGNSSPGSNYNDLSPKATIAKQVRRRSRASRRTPTTLLNATIKNFRTLVQQYTGSHSTTSASTSGKGPITLSFGSSSQQQNDFPASFETAFGRDDPYTGQAQVQDRQQHYNNQQHVADHMYEEKQNPFSFRENTRDFSDVSHSGSSMLTVEKCGWQ
ncbi:hypothetical protein ACH5RR_015965 [Cinchona calisaya]|uniref:VQ domain-containing protein n=1 Tax=Cinchona calisaya TaxID=153742 RepID=A0ABD2ZUN6_9GENT